MDKPKNVANIVLENKAKVCEYPVYGLDQISSRIRCGAEALKIA